MVVVVQDFTVVRVTIHKYLAVRLSLFRPVVTYATSFTHHSQPLAPKLGIMLLDAILLTEQT